MVLVQLLASGLGQGGIYALMGLGLTLIYRSTTMMNFAHGEAFMLTAVVAVIGINAGLSYGVAILVALAVAALLGSVMYAVAFRPLENSDHVTQVFATVAMGFITVGAVHLFYGTDLRRLPPLIDRGPLQFGGPGGPVIAIQDLVVIGLVVLLTIVFGWVFLKTPLGAVLRATTQNQRGATLVGIEVRRVFALMWTVGVILAGVAGVLAAPTLLVGPGIGIVPMTLAFAGMALGGFGDFRGAMVGGLLIGLIAALASFYLSTKVGVLAPYLVILMVLMVRPRGIFGTSEVH